MRSEDELNRVIALYSDMIKRICLIHLKNHADTEDIFQGVFLKYVLSSVVFENDAHEKAWFIRVTINACKDLLKSFFTIVPLILLKCMNKLQLKFLKRIRQLLKQFYDCLKNIVRSFTYVIMKVIQLQKSVRFWEKM